MRNSTDYGRTPKRRAQSDPTTTKHQKSTKIISPLSEILFRVHHQYWANVGSEFMEHWIRQS